MNKKIKKAIIPAAGLGTRFLPITKAMPKEMLPIIDKPTIQFIVEEAVESGIDEILIIVSSTKNSIIDHFDYSFELEQRLKLKKKENEYNQIRKIADMAKIHYVRQKEPMGLGHAILESKSFISNEPFAVFLGDDLIFKNNPNDKYAIQQCMELYYQTKKTIIGVKKVNDKDISKYGIIDPFDKSLDFCDFVKLKSVVEKPEIFNKPSNYAILGRYIFTPEIFKELEENIELQKSKANKSNEIDITSSILSLIKKDSVFAKKIVGKRYDIGSKIGFIKATIDEALKKPELKDELFDYFKKILKTT